LENYVAEQPDFFGPGEYTGPNLLEAESNPGPIPDGEMAGVDPRRRTIETQPVDQREANDIPARSKTGEIRLSSDLHEAAHRVDTGLTEQSRDQSANNEVREKIYDPVQDDSGPQSDQG